MMPLCRWMIPAQPNDEQFSHDQKLFYRHVTQHGFKKFYTIINVLCLTIGIAFAMLIGIFIYGELEVNKGLKEVDELFLVQNKPRKKPVGSNSLLRLYFPEPLSDSTPSRMLTILFNPFGVAGYLVHGTPHFMRGY